MNSSLRPCSCFAAQASSVSCRTSRIPSAKGARSAPGQIKKNNSRASRQRSNPTCLAAGSSADDWDTDELWKLQQQLLQEVAERKRLASELIQRLRAEAASGRVCIVDTEDKPSQPFTAAPPGTSLQQPVMAFVDAPVQGRSNAPEAQPKAPPSAMPKMPRVTPPPVPRAKAPPAPSPRAPSMPPSAAPRAKAVPAPPSLTPPGSPQLPPVGAPPVIGSQPSAVPPVGTPPPSAGGQVSAPNKTPEPVVSPNAKASPPKVLDFPPQDRTAQAPKQIEEAKATTKPQAASPGQEKKLPLAGENVMKAVVVGAECAPWVKTGGLGDVMGALPKALAERGHRTMVVIPRYDDYFGARDTQVRVRFRVFNSEHEVGYFHMYKDGVDYVFVEHGTFHGKNNAPYSGSRLDIAFRCALLCKAALEAPWHVPCGGVCYGDDNLVFIANDWHTALLPVYLEAHYRKYDQMTFARSLFVIHNVAHQGRGPFQELEHFEIPHDMRDAFFLDDPIGGEHMNIMKAGILAAHRVVAVSHGYAWECQTQEGGWGLDAILRETSWKMRGIVNGIDLDEWNPATDVHLKTDGYKNYSIVDMAEGKAACKAALQKELGLPVNPKVPLLGFIGRLDYQKGVDLIRDSYDWMMSEGCQLIMLGSGRTDLENDLRNMENSNPQKCKAWVGFNVAMAHRITAGCDILLMPSRFEPCGLNQLYAMHYGTVPVVHAVGGLRDTVQPYDPYQNTGTGWTFSRAEAEPLKQTLYHALETYRHHKDSFCGIQKRGMELDLSWNYAAEQYEEVMVAAKYQW